MGGASPVNPLPGGTVTRVVTTPALATTNINVNTDGTLTGTDNAGTDFSHAWFQPTGGSPGSSYWVRFTQVSGTAPDSGTLNTWLALSSNRSIGYSTTNGVKIGTFTIEIASDSGGTNIVAASSSGAYSMDCESTP